MDRMDYLSNSLFSNPYLIGQIVSELDIRTLFQCHCLSKEFFDATAYEYEKRKDLIHLYLLRYDSTAQSNGKDTQRLFDSFIQFTKNWLNMRPKHALILIGGYRHSIDYRLRNNALKNLSQYLPKECRITYLDVGHTVLTSSIRYKSLTNYGEHNDKSLTFQRTAFPCMSCLLIPEMEGIEVKSYYSISEVQTQDIKTVLFFETSRVQKSNSREIETRNSIHGLIARLKYNVSFGGGCVKAGKTMTKCLPQEDTLRDYLILTIGGHQVQSSSAILSTTNSSTYSSQLELFRDRLGFDCTDWQNSMSIAFVFANQHNFSSQFTAAFQTVFPFVGIFGFQSNNRMFGKYFANDTNFRNKICETIDPKRSSVVVIVHMKYKRFPTK